MPGFGLHFSALNIDVLSSKKMQKKPGRCGFEKKGALKVTAILVGYVSISCSDDLR